MDCPSGVAAGSISNPEPARHRNTKLPTSSQVGWMPASANFSLNPTARSTSAMRM